MQAADGTPRQVETVIFGTGFHVVEVRPEAQAAYNPRHQRRMRGTVWTTGGRTSWYLDTHGHNTTLWPTFTWRLRRARRRFQPVEYLVHDSATIAPCGCSSR